MLFLFIITLIVSFIVVRIGAIAFQLTGLEWSLAKFQSLSCFTGTGFTTKETEMITGNLQRRKIASILMVLGNAGLVTMIITGASSIRANVLSVLSKRYLPLPEQVSEQFAQVINIVIVIAAVAIIYKVFTNRKLTLRLTNFLREKIIKKEFFHKVSFEELVVETGGYGVSRVKVFADSPVLNKTLIEADLRKRDITVLAIIRGGETMPNPGANMAILRGDELVCFGRLENIRSVLYPSEEVQSSGKKESQQ
ncbi:MAG: TrkA C-terminal domain-containing protein [Phycisphaerae bacterium]|jgi:hypothetical protein